MIYTTIRFMKNHPNVPKFIAGYCVMLIPLVHMWVAPAIFYINSRRGLRVPVFVNSLIDEWERICSSLAFHASEWAVIAIGICIMLTAAFRRKQPPAAADA